MSNGACLGLAFFAFVAYGCVAPRAPSGPPKLDPASFDQQQELELLTSPHTGLATPDDAIVRVVGPQMTCTGTMIAPDLVLTAHHCVVLRGPKWEYTTALVPAADMEVQLGGDYLPWGHVGLEAVVAPPCGEAGGAGDIAVLVLERPIVGLATLPPRLEDAPKRGERLDPVGFGRCARSPEGIRRRPRIGGAIAAVDSGTMTLQTSICPGDSGGPLLDMETGEVVGVVSLSAMDADEDTRDLSIGARLDPFRAVFAYARQIADGSDPNDMPPLACAGASGTREGGKQGASSK